MEEAIEIWERTLGRFLCSSPPLLLKRHQHQPLPRLCSLQLGACEWRGRRLPWPHDRQVLAAKKEYQRALLLFQRSLRSLTSSSSGAEPELVASNGKSTVKLTRPSRPLSITLRGSGRKASTTATRYRRRLLFGLSLHGRPSSCDRKRWICCRRLSAWSIPR